MPVYLMDSNLKSTLRLTETLQEAKQALVETGSLKSQIKNVIKSNE